MKCDVIHLHMAMAAGEACICGLKQLKRKAGQGSTGTAANLDDDIM